ncbi:MAG: hypothetical protein KDC85_07420 [Saprospiraceae bacterium]|nr:hypothetical protein [Saprospiraceae bacterium]MCB9322272.1 hypothetical protein [Lewinellaceae bacterium]
MTSIKLYTDYQGFASGDHFEAFQQFVDQHIDGNYFQSADFFSLSDAVDEFAPILMLAINENFEISGSLLGVFQSNGKGVKSWLSRRLIVLGGPLIKDTNDNDTLCPLLDGLMNHASGRAIFIEFRNLFDLSQMQESFQSHGFQFQPYLNFLVKLDNESAVLKRMQGNKRRQITKSITSGARIKEAESASEVKAFYQILKKLYEEKVKKPIPGIDLFLKGWEYGTGKLFVISYSGKIIGGAFCPIFKDKVIYDWFRCGLKDVAPGVFAGVLAAWASIDYGLKNRFKHMDFMGAGQPDQPYGVRDFKAPFGGEMVSYGRFLTVINKPLYACGKWGLKIYQSLK